MKNLFTIGLKMKKIEVLVSYHRPFVIMQSDVIVPIQSGKALSKFKLDMIGDDTGNNISKLNNIYAECTAMYWLWNNSTALVKGLMQYRRYLNLNGQNSNDPISRISVEELEKNANRNNFIQKYGLTKQNIQNILTKFDGIVRYQDDISGWFDGTIEDQYKVTHGAPYLWDKIFKILEKNNKEFYEFAKVASQGTKLYFKNSFILKRELFDELCNVVFCATEELRKNFQADNIEFNDGFRNTSRYLAFIVERISGLYLQYLEYKGAKFLEVPTVEITEGDFKTTEDLGNYDKQEQSLIPFSEIFPLNQVKTAIVLSTDDNYVPYCATTIASMCANYVYREHIDEKLDIVILVNSISDENLRLFYELKFNNAVIRIVSIKKLFSRYPPDTFTLCEHFSIETYSRLFIPEIFKEYKKVLWLDSDLVVNADIKELLNIDMQDNWFAACQDMLIASTCFTASENNLKKELRENILHKLKMTKLTDYFQAGVMLWNIQECIKNQITRIAFEKLKVIEKPMFVDQDILNSITNGKHVLTLSPLWNVAWNASFDWKDFAFNSSAFLNTIHWLKNAKIIHYCGWCKPWYRPNLPYANKFWKFLKNTPFYEEVLFKYLVNNTEDNKRIKSSLKNALYNEVNEYASLKLKIFKYKVINVITMYRIGKFKHRLAHLKDALRQLM